MKGQEFEMFSTERRSVTAYSDSALVLAELTDHGRRLLANICTDHLSIYRCTTEERRLCERIIKAAP